MRSLSLALAVVILLCAASAGAVEYRSPRGDWALDLQDGVGWTVIQQGSAESGIALTLGRPDGLALEVATMMNPVQLSAREPSVVKGLREQMTQKGGRWLTSRETTHQGIPALDFDAEVGAEVPALRTTRWLGTRDRVYQVSVIRPIAARIDPAEVEQCLGRFRLLGEVQAASGTEPLSAGPWWFPYALLAGLTLTVLAATVVALLRRKR